MDDIIHHLTVFAPRYADRGQLHFILGWTRYPGASSGIIGGFTVCQRRMALPKAKARMRRSENRCVK